MKVGDLVRCCWQPTSGEYDEEKKGYMSLPIIEDKLGIIIEEVDHYRDTPRFRVLFTHVGYEHTFVETVLERVSESR